MRNSGNNETPNLDGTLNIGKSHHSSLPKELEPHYLYAPDGGHCINVVLENEYADGHTAEDFMVPVPFNQSHSTNTRALVVGKPFSNTGNDFGDPVIYDFINGAHNLRMFLWNGRNAWKICSLQELT